MVRGRLRFLRRRRQWPERRLQRGRGRGSERERGQPECRLGRRRHVWAGAVRRRRKRLRWRRRERRRGRRGRECRGGLGQRPRRQRCGGAGRRRGRGYGCECGCGWFRRGERRHQRHGRSVGSGSSAVRRHHQCVPKNRWKIASCTMDRGGRLRRRAGRERCGLGRGPPGLSNDRRVRQRPKRMPRLREHPRRARPMPRPNVGGRPDRRRHLGHSPRPLHEHVRRLHVHGLPATLHQGRVWVRDSEKWRRLVRPEFPISRAPPPPSAQARRALRLGKTVHGARPMFRDSTRARGIAVP
jgi:hypothetical protein